MPENVRKELDFICETIARTVDAEKIYLFGSYAYGTPTPESDLDLYVVLPDDGPRSTEAVSRIYLALRGKRNLPLDVLASHSAMFRSRQAEATLERKIVREGELLYERTRRGVA